MKLLKWPEKSRAALYILLIFLCGIVTGALAMNVWIHWGPDNRAVLADAPSSRSRHQRTVEKFTRELDLTPDQVQKFNHILDETRTAFQAHQSEIDVLREQGRDRIRELLTDEQKPKYEQMLARIDAHRKHQKQ